MLLFVTENDSLALEGVDFDEPMEVEHQEDKPVAKDDAKLEPRGGLTASEVKVEQKAEPQDPVLM